MKNSMTFNITFVNLIFLIFLDSALAESKKINSCLLHYTHGIKSYSDIDVSKLRAKYRKIEQKMYWKSYVEDSVDISQLIHKDIQTENIKAGAPKRNFELFGIENYKSFVEARDYLNGIPEGSLSFTPELIKNVHRRSALHLNRELGPIQKALNFWFVEPGVYKKRNNRGEDPLFNPLSEEQFQSLKANPYTQFVELPWPISRANKRRGYIVYGKKQNVEKDIQDLCDWANSQLLKVKSGEADAIDLAAEFQWRYVSIHPMVDGNGRSSMLLANRILEEADLPPVMMTMTGFDIYYSPQVWSAKIKQSIFDFEQMASDPAFKASLEKETPNLFMTNFKDGPRLALIPESARGAQKNTQVNELNKKFESRWPLLKRELFAENESQEVIIGNQRFVAMMDGFFYNKYGVPHEIRMDVDGKQKLFPINDETAYLYSLGGVSTTEKRFFKRSMNEFLKTHYQEFFKFMKQYGAGINMSGVEVVDYSHIAKSNKFGTLFLYDWQKPLMKSALEIKDNDPLKVLSQTRGYQTNFEKAVHFGDKTNLHEVLAQYQLMDLKYSKYQDYALKNEMLEEQAIILKSRKKLFDAAKQLLDQRTTNLEKALREKPELFPSAQEWQFFLAYYKVSPLKYSTFEEYHASKDEGKMILIRADQGASRYLGFISNSLGRDFIDRFPKGESIKGYLNKLDQALSADKPTGEQTQFLESSIPYRLLKSRMADASRVIRNLNRVMQMSKYDTRGMAPEFERASFEQYLHSVNDPFKVNVSFSTNTSIYIRSKKIESETETSEIKTDSKDVIPFTFDSKDARVYFVRMDKSDVKISEASKYFRQYEILKPDMVMPFNVTDSFGNDFFNADGSSPVTKELFKIQTDHEAKFTVIDGLKK